MQRYDEIPEEVTAKSLRIESDEPASNSTRIARLEGKFDLLAAEVRAMLLQTATTSKKLLVARTLGAGVAGALAALAPQHAGQAGKLIDALLALFS